MALRNLEKRPLIDDNKKLSTQYGNLEMLISELKKRGLPKDIESTIDNKINEINVFSGPDEEWGEKVAKTQSEVVAMLEKELKWVTKNHYRNMWLPIGMTAFGLPFGVVFGLSLGNLALLGIGLPIGMAIGIGVGMSLDKKAAESGNQLDVEFKH